MDSIRRLEKVPLKETSLVMQLRRLQDRKAIVVHLSRCIFTKDFLDYRDQALGLVAWSMGLRYLHDIHLANMTIGDLQEVADKLLSMVNR